MLIQWAHAARSVPPAMATLAGGGEQAASSVVYVTAPSEEVANQLATSIVEKKLAACVNIIPGGCMLGLIRISPVTEQSQTGPGS
jgi:hypothetical protein